MPAGFVAAVTPNPGGQLGARPSGAFGFSVTNGIREAVEVDDL